MATTRIPTLVVLVLLMAIVPSPAGAADDADSVRAKKVSAAAKLDALKADDIQLESAVRTLDAGIAVQSRETDAARQAANAAAAAVDAAAARLVATERKMSDLRTRATAVAVQAYVNPSAASFLELMKARDLAEASRRQTLMSQVVEVDRDVLGELRAVRQDLQSEQNNLLALRDRAQDRKRDATEKLSTLQQLRTDQVRLRSALDVRIREFTAEVEALAREEAVILGLIRTRQASGQSVDGRAGPRSSSGLVWPSAGGVSSPFGPRWGAMHTGIDIDSGYGAPIVAAKGGIVISAGWYGGYGQCTIIDHGGGLTTLYAHQSSMLVSEGQSVGQGETIGYVGGTGNVTGPHLHFETRVGGSPQNPMNFLP